MRACLCGGRIAPSNLRIRIYWCARCIYRRSGKPSRQRYRLTEKCRASKRRYHLSPKGRAKVARSNAKAVRIGQRKVYFPTPEAARAAQEIVNQRLADFKQRQHESQSR